jgi:DNA-binding NtrC family response regulator
LEGPNRFNGGACLGTAVVLDRDSAVRVAWRDTLTAAAFDAVECVDAEQVSTSLLSTGARILLIGDLAEGDPALLRLIGQTRLMHPRVRVIACPSAGSESLAIEAFRAGAADYLNRPIRPEQISAAWTRSRWLENDSPASPSPLEGLDRLVGGSPSMNALRDWVVRAAAVDSNVLISGETGTGKELVSELIHLNSPRRSKPFVQVNCAAIPEPLIESELFGYERGAFTGAFAATDGKLALAKGGTVFLDEIGDLSPAAQAKLLRAIEGKQIYRLGGRSPITLDIRVLAATNRDLEADVASGRFRADLFYRLNVVRIQTPALRDRMQDLLPLLDHFIATFNRTFGAGVEGFSSDSLELLARHSWPGNVRELRNFVEASFVHLSPRNARCLELPEPIRHRLTPSPGAIENEKERLLKTLLTTGWNRSLAAERLNWSRMTVYRKIKAYGLVNSNNAPPDAPPRHSATQVLPHLVVRKTAAG